MIRKTLFFFTFNLLSPPKQNNQTFQTPFSSKDIILQISQAVDFYKNEVTHLKNNFTALKKITKMISMN